MDNKVFQEENHCYQFDFSSAVWATDGLHNTLQNNKANILSDVDFIAETDNSIILLEYKNANIQSVANPDAFKPTDQKTQNKIAFKFYDSWIYLKAIGKSKPIRYVLILEYPNGDSTTRKAVRNKIIDLLPFKLQKLPEIKQKMISQFEVLTIDEWNAHEEYKKFPITPISIES